jgi:recombinational DNA repair protein RecT
MVELARRSREIAGIHAEVVYEGEKFNVSLGTKRAIEHEPWYLVAGAEPGKIILAYATWVDVATGHTEFHVCARDRLNRAKDAAQTDMVWRSDPAAMCRKTAIIDASRFWTLSPEAQQAVAWEEQAERGEAQTLPTDDQGDPAKPGDPLAGFADPPAGQTPPPDQGPVTDDDLNRVMDV